MQTSRRTLAAEYLADALITSRNSGIDFALVLAIGISGVLSLVVSPLLVLLTVAAGAAYVVRGYAHDKADRNAEESRVARQRAHEREIRWMLQH